MNKSRIYNRNKLVFNTDLTPWLHEAQLSEIQITSTEDMINEVKAGRGTAETASDLDLSEFEEE
jgi:hypothetical protein